MVLLVAWFLSVSAGSVAQGESRALCDAGVARQVARPGIQRAWHRPSLSTSGRRWKGFLGN